MAKTLELQASQSFQEGCKVTVSDKGTIKISVTEEKAVDSYNSEFECYWNGTKEQAIQLRDYLNQHLPK